jgi:integrase
MATVFKRGGKGNRGGSWYVQWYNHAGKRHSKCAKTTDRAAAERIAAKYEADAALRREGVVDVQLESIADQSRRSVESHLADFEAKMRAADCSRYHVHSTLKYIREICAGAAWKTVAEISADGVNRHASALKMAGVSNRLIQAHLTAIKGFARWLVTDNKLPRDPLVSVRKPNPKTDRRYERRMILPAEWDWIRQSIKRDDYNVPARERLLLCATAIQTGLRSNELRSLTPGKLFFDNGHPYIVCKAGNTKNAKDCRQYIQPDLADALRSHVATRRKAGGVFKMPDASDVSAMFKADLAVARAAWIEDAAGDRTEQKRRGKTDFLSETNHEGEVADFHSLRHTCGAWLATAGAHPKAVQTIMRHSTITLTMDTYGHLFPGQEADAIALLPRMFPDVQIRTQQSCSETT